MPEPIKHIPMNLMKLLAVLALVLAPSTVFAQSASQSPISAESRVSQRQITVGDIVTYSIIVRHEPGIHVLPPNPIAYFEKGFEYIDQGASEIKESEGQLEEIFWFKFRADKVGFYNLSNIPIEFTAPASDDPSQQVPGTLKAPKAVIEIRSVLFLEGEANDIKDIKPIIGAGFDWQRYLNWIVLGMAALLAVGGFFWWLTRRKRTSIPAPSPVPNLKPHEIALADLDQLLAKKLLASGQLQEHYFELSEILRRYLGTLLSIPALDWTTEEIGEYISSHSKMDNNARQTILALLPATDQIKFAKAPVELQTALNHVEAVRNYIRSTTPEMTSKFQVKSPMVS
jgi:hypothetical protein